MIFNIQKTVGMDHDLKQIFALYCIKKPIKHIPNFVLKVYLNVIFCSGLNLLFI